MSVSLLHARIGARRLAAGILLPALAACSGDDLVLPDDRTPVELKAVSGDGQTAVAGTPVPNPLVVEALDRAGRPVEGAVIRFQFVERPAGAAIAPPASETNPDGRASVEVTLGSPVGDQPVEARLDEPANDLRVRFQLTAIRSNNGGGGGGGSGDGDDGGDDGGGGGDDGGGGDGGDGGDVGDDDGSGGGGGGQPGKGKGKGKGKNGNGGNGGGNDDEDD